VIAYKGDYIAQRRISDTLCRLATGEWRKVVEETVSLREAHCYLKIWRALWKVSAAMQP
jgi:hypothetical protein